MNQISVPKKSQNSIRIGLAMLLKSDEVTRLTKLCQMATTADDYDEDAPAIRKLQDWLIQLAKDQEHGRPGERISYLLNNALGNEFHKMPSHVRIDQNGVHTQLAFPDDLSCEAMLAWMLGVAMRSGQWKYLRQCEYKECTKFFFDHKKRGGMVQRFCCPKHSTYHRRLNL